MQSFRYDGFKLSRHHREPTNNRMKKIFLLTGYLANTGTQQ